MGDGLSQPCGIAGIHDYVCTRLGEALSCGQPDAGAATGNDRAAASQVGFRQGFPRLLRVGGQILVHWDRRGCEVADRQEHVPSCGAVVDVPPVVPGKAGGIS